MNLARRCGYKWKDEDGTDHLCRTHVSTICYDCCSKEGNQKMFFLCQDHIRNHNQHLEIPLHGIRGPEPEPEYEEDEERSDGEDGDEFS